MAELTELIEQTVQIEAIVPIASVLGRNVWSKPLQVGALSRVRALVIQMQLHLQMKVASILSLTSGSIGLRPEAGVRLLKMVYRTQHTCLIRLTM
jgi:hypothetical protein